MRCQEVAKGCAARVGLRGIISIRSGFAPAALEGDAMFRQLLLGTCLAVALTACISEPYNRTAKAVNTALTGACLAAQLYPCTIESSEAGKSKATEAKAAAVRARAQRDSNAANEDAVRRSSCLTDTGPRLPVSSSQCAPYGLTY